MFVAIIPAIRINIVGIQNATMIISKVFSAIKTTAKHIMLANADMIIKMPPTFALITHKILPIKEIKKVNIFMNGSVVQIVWVAPEENAPINVITTKETYEHRAPIILKIIPITNEGIAFFIISPNLIITGK